MVLQLKPHAPVRIRPFLFSVCRFYLRVKLFRLKTAPPGRPKKRTSDFPLTASLTSSTSVRHSSR